MSQPEAHAYFPIFLEKTHLIGHLMEEESHTPIPNARLSVAGTSLSTTTDSIGTFHFEEIPLGPHQLLIDIPKHFPVIHTIDAQGSKTENRLGAQPALCVRRIFPPLYYSAGQSSN